MNKPLVLCILDGVGINNEQAHNAVALANTPYLDGLLKKYPNSKLDASGVAVGLPDGTMGNSEVGHITIGSGRIVNQFLNRFQQENLNQNPALGKFINNVKKSGGIVHLSGLMSDGRVHANIDDIISVAKQVLLSGLKICIHFIADGRDVLPESAQVFINLIKQELGSELKSGQVFFGTLSGRYYAMDRNQNLDRIELAFDAIANATSEFSASSIDAALMDAYARGEKDEFIRPTLIMPGATAITKKDGFLFGNYRSDRARQIMRPIITTGAEILCFSQYGMGLNEFCPAILDDIPVINTLGDILEKHGKTQLRIAETEKYNHVTYFFDAERDINFIGEEKILIASPDVATFDIAPEMAAPQITDTLISKLPEFDVVILNYANGDMVGHTAIESAAIRAMECLDDQLSRLIPAVLDLGGTVLITADHGNAEQLWDAKNNAPWTAHTTNMVNLIVVSDQDHTAVDGGLSDVAPTILNLLGIAQPPEMTGKNLVG